MKKWIIWGLAAAFFLYKYVVEVSPSIMTDQLLADFKIDAAQLGNLTSNFFYAYLLMQIPVGLLIDRYGPRLITTSAIFLLAIGSLIFSLADSYYVASFSRFIAGIGAAFAWISGTKLISIYFEDKKFALLTGLLMSFGMLGAVIGQAPLSYYVTRYGWHHAMQVITVLGVVLSLAFFVTVRKQHLHAPEIHHGISFIKKCKEVFKTPKSWTISLYSALAFAPITAFGGLWGVPFIALKYEMYTTVAAKYISLIFIGFALGAPVFAKISSQLKKRKSIMAWGTFISLFLILGILYLPKMNHFALAVLLFSFGFFMSSFLLSFTVIHEIHLPMFTATAIGFMNACNALVGALLDPLIGLFLDLGWKGNMMGTRPIYPLLDYKIALVFLPLFLFFSLGFLFFVKETHCHQHHEKKKVRSKVKRKAKSS